MRGGALCKIYPVDNPSANISSGFNQRYISKVEQTLGEKVDDITSSYCRLTAKL